VRGELDFSALAGDVAAALNEIAFTKDPRAPAAARAAGAPPARNVARRALQLPGVDVAQIVQLVDEAISEMRAAAGEQKFDLNFVANVETPRQVRCSPRPRPLSPSRRRHR
jgi:hypothetical protein